MTTGSWLILFQAAHCPHCKALEPHFSRLAHDEGLKDASIVVAIADIALNRKSAARFGIRGSPTILFLHKKLVYTYKGKREYESLKEFVLGGFNVGTTGRSGTEGSSSSSSSHDSHPYNARPIPPPISALQEYIGMMRAIGLELQDSALGKNGPAGYALICMIGIVSILVIMFMGMIVSMFIPAKKSTSKGGLSSRKTTKKSN
jgi:thiol-disulfide isomerase/thioredoxin